MNNYNGSPAEKILTENESWHTRKNMYLMY